MPRCKQLLSSRNPWKWVDAKSQQDDDPEHLAHKHRDGRTVFHKHLGPEPEEKTAAENEAGLWSSWTGDETFWLKNQHFINSSTRFLWTSSYLLQYCLNPDIMRDFIIHLDVNYWQEKQRQLQYYNKRVERRIGPRMRFLSRLIISKFGTMGWSGSTFHQSVTRTGEFSSFSWWLSKKRLHVDPDTLTLSGSYTTCFNKTMYSSGSMLSLDAGSIRGWRWGGGFWRGCRHAGRRVEGSFRSGVEAWGQKTRGTLYPKLEIPASLQRGDKLLNFNLNVNVHLFIPASHTETPSLIGWFMAASLVTLRAVKSSSSD